MKYGTRVTVNNPKLKTHGQQGKVILSNFDYIEVLLDSGKRIEYKKENLSTTGVGMKKSAVHIAIIDHRDGECLVKFDPLPSIETMEEEFTVSTGEVIIGTMEEIKESISDGLDSWDYVIGLIDGVPFKASNTIVFEGGMK